MIFSNIYNRKAFSQNTNTITIPPQNSNPVNFRFGMLMQNTNMPLIPSPTPIPNPSYSTPQPYLQNGIPITNLRDAIRPQDPTGQIPKKVKWGPPTWFLLHSLACKVYDDKFSAISKELLQMIYMICTNLPCPDCANHAKNYLDGINFNTIQSKEELKKMLCTFHNTVNQRKGYSIFLYSDYTAKYSRAILSNIIDNFMHHFSDKTRSPKLMASDFQRTHLVKYLKTWFQNNLVNNFSI
jgi:hypothetical protein